MFKRLFIPLLFLAVLFAFPQRSSAQVKSFYWERVEVNITLLENGDMRVVENQTLVFSGGTFTFGFRTIPTAGTDGIVDVSVSEGDQLYRPSSSNSPYTYELIDQGTEIRVNWYFPPAQGRHTYSFSYLVKGAVRVATEPGGGDQIFWKAIPADHPARIDQTTVTIRLPEGVRPQVYTGTNDPLVAAYVDGRETNEVQIELRENGRLIIYSLNRSLATGQMLEVRVQFPPDALDLAVPDWQRREQVQDAVSLVMIIIGGLVLVGGPLTVLLLWYTRGRDPEVGLAASYLAEPPDNLPPAVVGALVDEHADMQDVVATLLDLAGRGYLTMRELNEDFEFALTDKPHAGLRPFEQRLIKALFGRKRERTLNSLRYKFAEKLPDIKQALYDEIVQEKLFNRSPDSIRSLYRGLAVVLVAIAIGAFVLVPGLIAGATGLAVLCVPAGVAVTAVTLLIVAGYMPAKTRKGAETAAKWNAFKQYLKDIEKYTNLEEAGEVFARYLPYAVAFGLERSWIRKFATVPATVVPPWYFPGPFDSGPTRRGIPRGKPVPAGTGPIPDAGTGPTPMPSLEGMSGGMTRSLESMSSGLTRMLTSTATILGSTPPSSSSGGSSGGFSGGGSSGGGSMGFG